MPWTTLWMQGLEGNTSVTHLELIPFSFSFLKEISSSSLKHHCISFDSEVEGYEAPKQCMQKSYTLSAAMSRRAEPLISRLSIPLSWCVMSTLHKLRGKKSFCKVFKKEPFCAVFKTSFSFFLEFSSKQWGSLLKLTRLSLWISWWHFSGTTVSRSCFYAKLKRPWEAQLLLCLEKQGAWWQCDFFPWNVEGWLEKMKHSTDIILHWGPRPWAMRYFNFQ